MKCTIDKCPNGLHVCCQTCEAKEMCNTKCETVKPCIFQSKGVKQDVEERLQDHKRKLEKKLRRAEIISVVVLIITVLIFGYIADQLNDVKTMQTDTLNTLMDTERQIDDLSKENAVVDNSVDEANKNATRGSERLVRLSQSEREYIERVCMAESNTLDGMFAVANVIYNRSVLWHKSPMEVVQQDCQFASPFQGEISAEAVQAVWAVFDENMKAFEDSNPTHFYADGTAEPYWVENKIYAGTRGGNLFYESRY